MRLATVGFTDPHDGSANAAIETAAAVHGPDGRWLLVEDLIPGGPRASLDELLPRWEENLAALRQVLAVPPRAPKPGRFPRPLTPREIRVPVGAPRTFRDFYAFESHVKTCREKRGLKMVPEWYEQPVFYFSNPCSLIGSESRVQVPQGCKELDYELELGVVIGRGGRNIAPEKAWEHVAGLTIINDFSARDLQRKEMAVGLGPAKGKDVATAVGPYLVTLDEMQDRIDGKGRVQLAMAARVNGRELSRGDAASMHFTWPQLIAQASRDATLFPGDLIGSGTVGTGCILELGPDTTGGWLKPGDVVELEIEKLGILRTPVGPADQPR
ncbi:MAG TPA: fumarylacetoacetate hydrolase family protein [Planctomycetota bacterium]|nr:fumarylacetoacetate hydrolase family protein [Planctomycetota bacterium]